MNIYIFKSKKPINKIKKFIIVKILKFEIVGR